LMSGASHRVVTERSKLAFPEVTIGLYPDVGGTWLLHRVPANGGLFLALTGAPLNASDAIYAGMADIYIEDQHRSGILDALTHAHWADDKADNAQTLTTLLHHYASQPAAGPLQFNQELVKEICAPEALEVVAFAIRDTCIDDPWLTTARETFAAGAPSSVRVAFELQRRAPKLSLADVFRLEYIVSLHCAAHGDFAEGIRALLIDKDRQPHWHPATLAEATSAWAETFFEAPWPEGEHPLVNLGAQYGTNKA
jgi:enoyl-CoA hydratase/carnithine racemase